MAGYSCAPARQRRRSTWRWLSGLYPAAVICEIMAEDGTMARLPQLERIAAKHGIKIISVADLIAFRGRHEQIIKKIVETPMPTEHGSSSPTPTWTAITGEEHVALVKGDPRRPTSRCWCGCTQVPYRRHLRLAAL